MEPEAGKRPAAQPEPTSATLKLYLLGRFEVVRGDTPIPPQSWRRRRPADLLKLIALAPGRALPREEAIQLLWPDKDPASGANNLHRALYDLRQILGGRWVNLDRGILRMRSDVWVDADAFESAAAAGDPGAIAAVTLYLGDLSPEDRDSAWLVPRRQALRRRFVETAIPLARTARESGDAFGAVPLLRRILAVEPATEEAHRLLMRLLAEGGRRADALRQYDMCELALRAARLGPPDADTRSLREAIQRGELGAQVRAPFDGYRRAARRLLGTSEPPPLRGRSAATLLFESIAEQGSGAIVLLGERGVGKTRLALEAARIAQGRGAVVLAGVPGAPGPSPCAAFLDAWADYSRAAGQLEGDPFADFAPGILEPGRGVRPDGEEARTLRRLDGVQRSLAAIGGGHPVFLLLDDIHRADETSVNLLHFLARSARTLKLMIVATCREDAVRSGAPVQMLLAHLDCERLARGVRVQRLGLDATRELIGDVLGTNPSDGLAAQIYRITDGSPFYTEEVTRAFKESGHLSVPTDPAAAVRARVAQLGPKAETFLLAAAVAGPRFEFEHIRPVTGLTAHEALQALELCLEARVLEEDGTGYHFHHSFLRETLYDSLPRPRRGEMHRALADAIEIHAGPAPGEEASEALGYHRRAGGELEKAFRHFMAAAHRAAARAGLREALGLFTQAKELADAGAAPPAEWIDVFPSLAEVQLALADLSGLGRTFETAFRLVEAGVLLPTPWQRARARRVMALGAIAGGDLRLAEARLRDGLGFADAGGEDEKPEILLLLAIVNWHAGRPEDARAEAERAVASAQRLGDPEVLAQAVEMRDLALASLGQAAPGSNGILAAPPAPFGLGPEQPFAVHLALWDQSLAGDRPLSELEQALSVFGERARAGGHAPSAAVSRAIEGAIAFRAARWDVAEAALRDGIERLRGAGCALGEAFARERLGALLTARGRYDEAMSVLGEGVVVAERAALRLHALARLHTTLARNRLAAGAVYAAEDCLREASEGSVRHGDCLACDVHFRPEVVRVALARGRLDEADTEATALEALASRRSSRMLGAVARLARARVLAAQERADEARAALADAREGFRTLGSTYDVARCMILESRLLAVSPDPTAVTEAQRLLGAAADLIGSVGAAVADT